MALFGLGNVETAIPPRRKPHEQSGFIFGFLDSFRPVRSRYPCQPGHKPAFPQRFFHFTTFFEGEKQRLANGAVLPLETWRVIPPYPCPACPTCPICPGLVP